MLYRGFEFVGSPLSVLLAELLLVDFHLGAIQVFACTLMAGASGWGSSECLRALHCQVAPAMWPRDGLVPKSESAARWGSSECLRALHCPVAPAVWPRDGLVPKSESAAGWGSSECLHALHCPVALAMWPRDGLGQSEWVGLL